MLEVKAPIHFEIAGHFTLSTDKRGKVGEFTNLITNAGLNNVANPNWLQSAFIGTGSTPPNVNDTDLAAYLTKSSAQHGSTIFGASSVEPYYCYVRITYRFAAGVAQGNLTEIGIGWRAGVTNNLICRTLIKDANGNPTTLTILPDEILDVTYELRQYIPSTDVTGSITFGGNLGGTYSYTLRPAKITTSSFTAQEGWAGQRPFNEYSEAVYVGIFTGGALGTIFSSPSGTSIGRASSSSVSPYVLDSYTCKHTYVFSVDVANHANGIKCMSFPLGNGFYQVEFNPPIPKTNMDSLSLTFQYSWGRKA